MATAQGYGAVLKDRRTLFDLDFHSGAGGVGSVGGMSGPPKQDAPCPEECEGIRLCSKQSRRCGKGPGSVSKAPPYTEFQRVPLFKLKGTCSHPDMSHEWNKLLRGDLSSSFLKRLGKGQSH